MKPRIRPSTLFVAGVASGIATASFAPAIATTALAVSVTWVVNEAAEALWAKHGKHINGAALAHLSAIIGRAIRKAVPL